MRCRSTAIAVLAFDLATSAGVRAELVRLSGTALSDTVAGATIELDTPVVGMTIPVKYSSDGRLTGEAGAMLAISLGAAKDRGRWWVDGDRLCHKWFKWFDADVQCLKVSRDGARLHWLRDDGQAGTATIDAHTAGLGVAPAGLGAPEVVQPQPEAIATPVSPPLAVVAPARGTIAPNMQVAPRAEVLGEKPSNTVRPTDGARVATPAPVAKAHMPAVKVAELKAPAVPPPVVVAQAKTGPMVALSGGATFRVAGVAENDKLNVRKAPSPTSQIVGVISPLGKGVRMTGTCLNAWCPVLHAGGTGWVNAKFLVSDPIPAVRRAEIAPAPRR